MIDEAKAKSAVDALVEEIAGPLIPAFLDDEARLEAAYAVAIRRSRGRRQLIDVYEKKMKAMRALSFHMGSKLSAAVWHEIYRRRFAPYVSFERLVNDIVEAKKNRVGGEAA